MFESLVNYKQSSYRQEVSELLNASIEENDGELCGDAQAYAYYICDLERRLDEIAFMKVKGELKVRV